VPDFIDISGSSKKSVEVSNIVLESNPDLEDEKRLLSLWEAMVSISHQENSCKKSALELQVIYSIKKLEIIRGLNV
jgi:hypothetical protein